MNDFQEHVEMLAAKHHTAIAVDLYQDRIARTEEATISVRQLFEAELAATKRALRALEQQQGDTLAALAQRAKEHGRACAAAIVAEAFDTSKADSLASLVARWRREPSRATTQAITACWADLTARAEAQLGAPLGDHVLAQTFVDQLVAERPAAVVPLAREDFGAAGRVVKGLFDFTRAASPVAAQTALEQIDHELQVAARHSGEAGAVGLDYYRALHALRRTHATHGDLSNARSAFEADQRRCYAEKSAAEAAPPPPQRPSTAAHAISWLR